MVAVGIAGLEICLKKLFSFSSENKKVTSGREVAFLHYGLVQT